MNFDDKFSGVKVAAEINRAFPDLKIESCEKIGEGMESVAYAVNRDLIFRFPKTEFARESLKNEIYALPKIRRRLPLAIPDFQFIESEAHFVGYPKIEGEDLTSEIFRTLTPSAQDEILKQLADFLIEIHRTDIADFPENGIEIQNFRDEYARDFAEIKRLVFPLIEESGREFISRSFDEYLADTDNFLYAPVFLHKDLSADHIMFNRAAGKLIGIIDFGDIGIGDADYDLMYLLDDYGEDFVRRFLRFYPHTDHRRLFAKLHFWDLADILKLVIYYRERNDAVEVAGLIKLLDEKLPKK